MSRSARSIALHALRRIDDGAYANLVLPSLLARSGLDERDRGFVTELVYGTTRMRRALDHVVDGYLLRGVDPPVRDALRLGAYQLLWMRLPPHAAVSETVAEVRGPARGLVNAVLRKVAAGEVVWPDDATRLSYPDWIVDRLVADLGADDALGALEQMDQPPVVNRRTDGYVQDPASQWVAELIPARAGDRLADLCAGPGGKATLLAHTGATVIAADVHETRAHVVAANARSTGAAIAGVVCADGRRPPLRRAAFDHVLVDAPCTGLGVLRRRPDARWRVTERDVEELAVVQQELLAAGAGLLRPGGVLTYSVCTLTDRETTGVDRAIADARPDLVALDPPSAPWRSHGRGALLLPQDKGTDGMFVLRLRLTPREDVVRRRNVGVHAPGPVDPVG